MGGRGLRQATLLVVVAFLGAACGVPLDTEPQALRGGDVPAELRQELPTQTTTTLAAGPASPVTIYLAGPERLVAVVRQVSAPASVEKVLQQLFTGPTKAESAQGLRTAISPGTTVLGAAVEAKLVSIDLSGDFAVGSPPDQIIAFAQVVFTATKLEGVGGVVFTRNGRRLEVPTGDGSITSTPLGPASYPQLTPR